MSYVLCIQLYIAPSICWIFGHIMFPHVEQNSRSAGSHLRYIRVFVKHRGLNRRDLLFGSRPGRPSTVHRWQGAVKITPGPRIRELFLVGLVHHYRSLYVGFILLYRLSGPDPQRWIFGWRTGWFDQCVWSICGVGPYFSWKISITTLFSSDWYRFSRCETIRRDN